MLDIVFLYQFTVNTAVLNDSLGLVKLTCVFVCVCNLNESFTSESICLNESFNVVAPPPPLHYYFLHFHQCTQFSFMCSSKRVHDL